MSVQVPTTISADTVEEISAARDEPEWLLDHRLDALDALDELELPDVIQTPGRRWTDLESLDFEGLVDPLDQSDSTERVDAEGAEVLSFVEAIAEHEDLVKEHFGSIVDPEENYLTALSAALFTTGTVI